MQDRLRLIGSPASPYTRKMLALLRFRQIPHAIIWGEPAQVLQELGLEVPKPVLHPVCIPANSQQALCDSSPLIRRLEADYPGREVIPGDAVLAFLDFLIEDYADEWCTKPMFHYRWHYAADADNAGTLLPLLLNVGMPEQPWQQFKEQFTERQISRLHVVGSSADTDALISASYKRLLKVLESHFVRAPFLLGDRPAACDFALFGQLSQLVGFDPTSQATAKAIAPRTVAWVSIMEDQSGLMLDQRDWFTGDSAAENLKPLLHEIGRSYVPTMLANAKAVAEGQQEWQVQLDGETWQQRSFPYQAKCLRWVREAYFNLAVTDREKLDSMLEGSGCERLFEGAP
jgi:glutathione S-transferase